MLTGKNILLIDDDKRMTEEISEILIGEGYDVTVANDGTKGNELLISHSYDLVLLDLKMPGLSGFGVLKKIRERTKTAKVIIITATPLGSDLLEDANALSNEEHEILKQANGIIKKPYNIEAMLKLVHNTIEGSTNCGK